MKLPLCLSVLLASASAGAALTLQVDYQYDDLASGGTGFFAANPLARAALEQAAADLSAAITSSLGAVPTDAFTGTNGSTTVTFDWALQFENPSQPGVMVKLPTFSLAADTVTMFVGMRSLLDSTLGQGGPGGAGIEVSTGPYYPSQLPGAIDKAEQSSNVTMLRGEGPVMGSLSGSFGTSTTDFHLSYGPLMGTLWFDNDTNNDGLTDSAATLEAFWHYDPATGVASTKSDLYSVALHEMLHALGIGSSETWDTMVSGSDWLGSEVIALKGSGANLISPGGDHILEGVSSFRLDGVAQEAAMDPTLTKGTRKYLTEVDLAFLRDIGYATVPEPSTGLALACGGVLLTLRRRRRD